MDGAKVGFASGVLIGAGTGCLAGELLEPFVGCVPGAIANSFTPLALATDLLTTGAGFAYQQNQIEGQDQQAWAQYEAACRN
jgi:hypothetical protein